MALMGTTQPLSSAIPEAPPTPPEEYLYPEVRDLLEAKVALGELCEAAGSSALDGRGAIVLAQLERFLMLMTHLRVAENLATHRALPPDTEGNVFAAQTINFLKKHPEHISRQEHLRDALRSIRLAVFPEGAPFASGPFGSIWSQDPRLVSTSIFQAMQESLRIMQRRWLINDLKLLSDLLDRLLRGEEKATPELVTQAETEVARIKALVATLKDEK